MPEPLSFTALLYRYFFFGWAYKDVSRGNVWERAAAWRHNRERADWLLTYIRRWAILGLLMFGLAVYCEVVLDSPIVSAFFYVPCVMTVPYNAVASACWWVLRFGGPQ